MLLPKPGEIISSIIENNPLAVKQNLSVLLPGAISSTTPMSVPLFNELVRNMQVGSREQAAEMLVTMLNVPALMNGPKIHYLSQLQNATGKFPARVLYEILTETSSAQTSETPNYTNPIGGFNNLTNGQLGILALAFIGMMTLLVFLIKIIQKVFQ